MDYNGEGAHEVPYTSCPGNAEDPAFDGMFCHMVPLGSTGEFAHPPYYRDHGGTKSWCSCQDSANNTYSCVRALGDGYNFNFCEWETGETEFYDLSKDPWNLFNKAAELPEWWTLALKDRLRHLKTCEGYAACNNLRGAGELFGPAPS